MSYYSTEHAKITLHLEGATTAHEGLTKLEYAARRRVVSAAVRAANSVVVKKARELCPVGKTGQLKKQLHGTVKQDRVSGTVYGYVRSSATKRQRKKGIVTAARYAHLVIGGTKPHSIEKGDELAMLKLPGGFYTRVNHPGAKPRPFMERAADAVFHDAIFAFAAKFDERLAVERAKVFQSAALSAIRGRF